MSVKPIPDGYHTITPYLLVEGAADLITFLQKGFDAVEIYRQTLPDGSVRHAEVRVGNSHTMISEAREGMSPMACMLYLYVEDVDATYQQALAAGGQSLRDVVDEFYGDRVGGVQFAGVQFWIATHKEDLSPEEIGRRAAEQGR